MKYLLITLLFILSAAAHADPFRDGVVAYQQKDYPQALQTWLPLAESGHVLAQTLVGSMYAYGEGIEQNDQEAFKWLSRAANSNSAQAQYNLAILYEKGLGVAINKDLAKKWFKAAADQGREDAVARYALLEENISNKEAVPTITKEPAATVQEDVIVSKSTEETLPKPSITSAVEPTQRIHVILNGNDSELLGPPQVAEATPLIGGGEYGLTWARQQPLDNYTIQLASSIESRLVETFKNDLQLSEHYAKTISEHNGSQWHALIYGSYKTVSDAKKEIDALPAKWKTWQPWIKKFSSISAIKH
ncbi:MAG: SEL1-like repeat protein [Sulfuriflexus sp.]|nr:SEL1-like repeat protein [Sulfuriflexus sp.]